LTSKKLLDIFIAKISDIIGQVRDKLTKDAKDYKLIVPVLKEPQ
jgi:hypothetical protein